jgi:hypothetical protein
MSDSITNETTTVYDDSPANPRSSPSSSDGNDPELAAVADAWPTLPEPIRAAILAMVKATTKRGDS